MKKRDLNSILMEIQKTGVREPETIRQYIRVLGNRTLYSLMFGKGARNSGKERYECWSYLEFVPLAYTAFLDLTEEEITHYMKHITVKDYFCLVSHLNDKGGPRTEPDQKTVIREDMEIANKEKLALICLLNLMLRAKGRGDRDINRFCTIHVNSLLGLMKAGVWEDDEAIVADIFYLIKESLDHEQVSWMSLGMEGDDAMSEWLQTLMLDSMEKIGFENDFSLPETIKRCLEMENHIAK